MRKQKYRLTLNQNLGSNMSNIFVAAKILSGLHMYKSTEMITEQGITNCIESNFRIQKPVDKSHYQFYQQFCQDFSLGKYTAYLLGREKRRQFYLGKDWLALKRHVMETQPNVCVLCKTTSDLQVDHIKPRWKYPDLELDPNNCQILCRACNNLKSGR